MVKYHKNLQKRDMKKTTRRKKTSPVISSDKSRPDSLVSRLSRYRFLIAGIFVGAFAAMGTITLLMSRAATYNNHCSQNLGCFAYVTKNDDSLYYNGNKLRLFGSSVYPLGVSWSNAAIIPYMNNNFSVAKQAGMNFARITDFMGSTPFNAQIWSNLKTVIQNAGNYGIYVSVDLTGYERYLCNNNQWAYAPGPWQNLFNTVNISRFDSSNNLVDFEVDGLGDLSYVGQPNGACTLTTSNITQIPGFYNTVAGYLHTMLPDHLVDSGGLSHINNPNYGIPWQSIYAQPNIDIAGTETYSASDVSAATANFLPWVKANHKPFRTEFGFIQGTTSCSIGSALPGHFSTPGFDDACRSVYFDNIYSTFNAADTNTNIDFWNLGNLVGAGHYDVYPGATPSTWAVVQKYAKVYTTSFGTSPSGGSGSGQKPSPTPSPTPTSNSTNNNASSSQPTSNSSDVSNMATNNSTTTQQPSSSDTGSSTIPNNPGVATNNSSPTTATTLSVRPVKAKTPIVTAIAIGTLIAGAAIGGCLIYFRRVH